MARTKQADIFTLIRQDDLAQVKALVEKDAALVNAVAPPKPADTKGMSPLQVSLTTGWHKDIADFLLDSGADVNYADTGKGHRPQGRPVLHDAVSVAIWNSRRYACVDPDDANNKDFEWKHSQAEAQRAYQLVKRMIEMGADVNGVNNYNDNALAAAVQQAGYLCPEKDPLTGRMPTGLKITPEMTDDFQAVFRLLIQAGADTENRNSYNKMTIRQFYENKTVWQIYEPVLRQLGK